MSCYKRVIEVLKDANKPMRLHHIQAEIRKQCRNALYPHDLLILSREDVGSRAHVYWLAKIRK